MDTMSNVTAHPALADGAARLPGQPAPAVPAAAGAMSIAPSRADIANQPNSLDTAALSYEGGAVAALDFTREVARRKAVRCTSPMTA